ncbi:MAG: hypothetical protein D9V45_07945 [Chloroflexi bacterium]|nr:MAG: hypothetical protein D9V45_07945 [Chloroflexota bacterium]
MATKRKQMQNLIRYYKDQTGKTEVDMREVAKFALSSGWQMPKPKDPLDRLAAEFSQAARDEIRHDQITGRPYRANHAIPITQGKIQYHLWVDIDEAPRKHIYKSLIMRREQMVGDGVSLTLDAQHWNNVNPEKEPIQMLLDFTDDVEWRLNAPEEDEKVA